MSSVVNKSGTRFAPKIRQRRVVKQLATPPTTQKDAAVDIDVNSAVIESQNQKEHMDRDDPKSKISVSGDVISMVESNESTSYSDTKETSVESNEKLKIDDDRRSSESKSSSNNSDTSQRRRSSRLNSLSGNNSQLLFRSSFSGQSNSPPTKGVNGEAGNRRLSTISNFNVKKTRMNSISEKDDTLRALKRRRMSARTSISKQSGSVHRISIVPVGTDMERSNSDNNENIGTPISIHSGRNITHSDNADGLYPNTDSKYQNYKIKNLDQIPKNLEDKDSERYVIDEERFTMAELCKHMLPIGKTSDNFNKAKEADKIKSRKRKERREIRKRAREEFKSVYSLTRENIEKEKEERKKLREDLLNLELPEFQPSTIQLKLNKEGTIAVDDDSTTIDRHKNASYENAQKEKVDENPFENLYNSATYGRNSYTDPWTSHELIKFYKALTMWGTDFNLIAQLFPYRTRKQVKAKFINEEKKHPIMIELALRSRLPPDFDRYCDEIRKKLGTIDDFNEKLEKLQIEHEQHLLEIEEAKELAKNEDLKHSKNKDINKKSSGGYMTEDLKTYRKSEIVLGTIEDRRKQTEEEVVSTV